jgi:sugar lactone lactonase YvrE
MSLRYRGGYISAEQLEEYGLLNQTQKATIELPFSGQVEYTTPGEYTFVVPENVTEISAVVVGGGGGGTGGPVSNYNAGSGGGLGWRNRLQVIPKTTINVVVGAGGVGGFVPGPATTTGNASFITLFSQGNSLDISAQDNNAHGMDFSLDGSKMYIVGKTGDLILQYNLSESWNVATASLSANINVTTTSGETAPQSLHFSNDGRKMHVSGAVSRKIIEYTLATPWDITTSSLTRYSPLLANSSSHGFTISDNGEYLYATRTTQPEIYQYKMVPALNVASSLPTEYVRGFTFKDDGTKLYVPISTQNVAQYSLSEAWNITTASSETIYSLSANNYSANSIAFKTDGTTMYLMDIPANANSNTRIFQYTLSTPWNVATSVYTSEKGIDSNVLGPASQLAFNGTGTKAYLSHPIANNVIEYNLSEAWNIQTLALSTANSEYNVTRILYSGDQRIVVPQTTVASGLSFKDDGTKMYITGPGGTVLEYDLSTPWVVKSATFLRQSQTAATLGWAETSVADLYIKDGSTFYLIGNSTDRVYPFTLTEAWNAQTLTAQSVNNSIVLTTFDANLTALTFKPDGTKLFVSGTSSDRVFSWNLSEAWNVATANVQSTSNLSVVTQESTPATISFNNDGTKLFVMGGTGDDINQYNLSDPYNINTASYSDVTVAVSGTVNMDQTPTALYWKDGTTFYMVGSTYNRVRKFTLANHLPYANIPSVTGVDTTGICFNSDFTKSYVSSSSTSQHERLIRQYDLNESGNLSSTNSNLNAWANNYTLRPSNNSNIEQLFLSPDGRNLYFSLGTDETIFQSKLDTPDTLSTIYYQSSPWNVTGLLKESSVEFSGGLLPLTGGLSDLYIRPDGKSFVVANNHAVSTNKSTKIDFWNLDIPYRLESINLSYSLSYSNILFDTANSTTTIAADSLTAVTFADSGKRLFLKAGSYPSNNDTVFSYDIKSLYNLHELVGFGGGSDYTGFSPTQMLGGGFFGEGGGAGGNGAGGVPDGAAGGGGAGGYDGPGASGQPQNIIAHQAIVSGGGGAGGTGTDFYTGGGGGVGIYGKGRSGRNGHCGPPAGANLPGSAGEGGSGGNPGGNYDGFSITPTSAQDYINGGNYGGGAASIDGAPGGSGAPGAARIIWGPGRAFPNTRTQDL